MTYQDLLTYSQDHPILFFDGECGLCDGFVQRIIKSDPDEVIHLAMLQSDIGQLVRRHHQLDTLSTALLIHQGKVYLRCDVPIRVAHILGRNWTPLKSLGILPRGLRDLGYNFIAKRRYGWFGKKECLLPHAYGNRIVNYE